MKCRKKPWFMYSVNPKLYGIIGTDMMPVKDMSIPEIVYAPYRFITANATISGMERVSRVVKTHRIGKCRTFEKNWYMTNRLRNITL